MPTNVDIKNYILEQLEAVGYIKCRPMMGEYLLYYKNILFGGIYDDKLLIKETKLNMLPDLEKVVPYPNAKPMLWIKNIEDGKLLKNIILTTVNNINNKSTK